MKKASFPKTDIDNEEFWNKIMKRFQWYSQQFDYSSQAEMDGILKLIKSHYNNVDESYPEYFQWEYKDNPAGNAIIWVAKHNSEIVGQYVVNMVKVKIGNEILLGSVCIKTLTRSDFRNKGIHLCLAHKTFETCRNRKVAFMYGFPNQAVYNACIERLGGIEVGRVPLFIRPLAIDRLLDDYIKNRLLKKISVIVVSPILNLYNFVVRIRTLREKRLFASKIISIKEIGYFDERINTFWETAKIKYKNLLVRDKEFLNWRYCNNPRRRYRIVIAEDEKKDILAYVILRVATVNNIKAGFIVDMLSKEDKLSILSCSLLITNAFDYFKANAVEIICCLMVKNNIYSKLLKSKGFFICPKRFEPQPFLFLIKPYSENLPNFIFSLNNWFLTLGDYDVI